MTGDADDAGSTDGGNSAPIDFDRLEVIRDRLGADDRFCRIEERPEFAPDRVVCVYDSRFYPSSVETARLEIAWYENGDFSLHYHEEHEDGTFDHRWDRHPSDHNAREHVHPGPDAPTPGDDTDHPDDWRDVLSATLAEIEERQRAFWRV
jgi:hypothetical protein